MTPTTDELKALFDDVTSAPPVVGDLAGTAARRGRAVRRRRTMVAAACVAVAVTAVAVPALHGRSTSAPPIGTPTPTTTDGDQPLPEYLRGGHLLASAQVADPQGTALTFTPTTLSFGLVTSCAGAAPPGLSLAYGTTARLRAVVRLNGRPLDGFTCLPDALGTDGDADFGQVTTDWSGDFGVVVGQPSQLTIGYPDGRSQPGTRWRLAVYQAVPLDEYPFPEPPERLSGLSASLLSHLPGRRLLFSGLPAGPQEGFTYTVPVEQGLTVRVETVAPGTLRMYVDDRLVWTHHSWTYDVDVADASFGLGELGRAPGDQVRIRFETDRFPPGGYAFTVHDALPPTSP